MYLRRLDMEIAAYLRGSGKTQAQLAREMGMTEGSLSKKRRGIRKFSVEEAARLSQLIGASLDSTVMADIVEKKG